MEHGGEAFETAGSAPAVLLVHGFTGTPWEIRPVAAALAACGFACVAPVLPGHGATPEALSRTRWGDWSVAVDHALDAALARHGSVVLVGMSLGGLLVLDAAARRPRAANIRGVVTLACALRLAPLAESLLRAAELLGDRLPDAYPPKSKPGGDVRDPAMQDKNPAYRVNPLRAARDLLVGQRAARAALPTLRAPLLVLHGLRDTTAPVAGALELVSRSGAADTTLVVLPRSGHLIAVDYEREEVARQVCAFVRRVAQPAPALSAE